MHVVCHTLQQSIIGLTKQTLVFLIVDLSVCEYECLRNRCACVGTIV